MKTILTAKLKLHTTSESGQSLLYTVQSYQKALNYTSRVALEHGKMSNQVKLLELVYPELREWCGLPSRLGYSVLRQFGATFKSLWTEAKQNAWHRPKGYTRTAYKGLDQAPVFTSHTTTFSYQQEYRFKSEQQVHITALMGLVFLGYNGYSKQHLALIQEGSSRAATFGAAKLCRGPRTKQFNLLVSVEKEPPDHIPENFMGTKGADFGERYLAVTTTPRNERQFFPGEAIRRQGEAFQRVRSLLQKKGTRGPKRRLRETRCFKANVSHQMAKIVVASDFLIGMENWKHIRERTQAKGKKPPEEGPVGFCGTGCLCRLQGPNRAQFGHYSRCRLHLPGMDARTESMLPERTVRITVCYCIAGNAVSPSAPIFSRRNATLRTLLICRIGWGRLFVN